MNFPEHPKSTPKESFQRLLYNASGQKPGGDKFFTIFSPGGTTLAMSSRHPGWVTAKRPEAEKGRVVSGNVWQDTKVKG